MRIPLKLISFTLLLLFGLSACKSGEGEKGSEKEKEQPEKSKSEKIIEEMVEEMGGEKAWENTRAIRWNFFGERTLYWDKKTNDVRIEMPKAENLILMNVDDMEGKVYRKGIEVTNKDTLDQFLKLGKQIWVNDSYWLFMPFKLNDSGVNLEYIKEDTTEYGDQADVLKVTFGNEVGETPANKYHIYVDKNSKLVTQWKFFNQASQENPSMVTTWGDYRKYGDILLSRKRGKETITDIAVFDTLSSSTFTSPDSVEIPEKETY